MSSRYVHRGPCDLAESYVLHRTPDVLHLNNNQKKKTKQTNKTHVLRLAPYVLRLTSYVLRLTPYVTHLMSYALRLTPYVSHLTSYVLRLTSYALRLTPYV